jgi:hypothetical protein
MRRLVSEPKDGVNAMDEITKEQPGDDGRGGDVVIMDWCWKNQDEKKYGEEGKNREFNTHGAGESLNGVTLKRRRNIDICICLALRYTRHLEGLLGNKTPQLGYVYRVQTPVQLLSTRGRAVATSGLPDGKQSARGVGP